MTDSAKLAQIILSLQKAPETLRELDTILLENGVATTYCFLGMAEAFVERLGASWSFETKEYVFTQDIGKCLLEYVVSALNKKVFIIERVNNFKAIKVNNLYRATIHFLDYSVFYCHT